MMPFARKFRFFVHGGEQIGEQEHNKDNRHGRQLGGLKRQFERYECGKEKLRVIDNDPGQQRVAQASLDRTKRRRIEGKESKKNVKDAEKKLVKEEMRSAAVAAGPTLLQTQT